MYIRNIIILSLIILFSPLQAQDLAQSFLKERDEVYFSFYADQQTIQKVSKIVSIDNYNAVSGGTTAYANEEEWKQFSRLNLSYKILTPPSLRHRDLNMKDYVDIRKLRDWDFYPTYDAYVDMMEQYQEDFPDLCEVFSIGNTNNGREILVAKISDNIGIREAEPQFLYTSTMHGDETAGYIMMLRLIDHLLNNYDSNPRIAHMINNIEIWINPLANPDGTYALGNQTVYGATRYNSIGVDLNRNFPDPEDGPHPDGNEWQIETLAFMNVAEENHFVMSSNIHGGAEVCNYPWDTWAQLHPDTDWWEYVCREFADTAQYHSPPGYMTFYGGVTNGYAWYSVAGGRQDYMTYFHQGREFTLEMSNDKLLPASQLNNHWDYTYRSFLNYLEQVLYGLKGTITDIDTGEPLVAKIYVVDHEEDSSWAYSGRQFGKYSRMLNEGTYDVRYSSPGYFPETYENVTIINRNTTILDVQLKWMFSVMEEPLATRVKLSPNPVTSNYFSVGSEYGIKEIRISNLSGKEVFLQKYDNEKRVFINTSGFTATTYLVNIRTEKGIVTRKIIKM